MPKATYPERQTKAMREKKSPNKTQIPAIPKKQIQWFRQQIISWSAANFRDFPWRRTTDPYAIFIAEVLLQKTDAATVEKIYETFLTRYPDIKAIARAEIEEIAQFLAPLGLHFRAERLHRSAQIILEKHGGQIPDQEAELMELPGIVAAWNLPSIDFVAATCVATPVADPLPLCQNKFLPPI